MNTTLSRQALSEARGHFVDWIDRYKVKIKNNIPLTPLEQYEFDRLTKKLADLDKDIATYDASIKKRSFLQILFCK